tara:strand:+ start:5611 stop:6141 length:531 start_codon:yes stop_codon:yes gene_type:complete
MMETEKHIPLKMLAKLLEEGVAEISNGEVSNEKLQELHIKSRDLYERLTVIRHKAYEALTLKRDEGEQCDTISKSQVNLIDSIEDVRSESLVEKHQMLPLLSVGEGLTILERANFTSVLFSNSDISFNDMLDAVDNCQNSEEAKEVFKEAINPSGPEEDIALARATFEQRIPRLFV